MRHDYGCNELERKLEEIFEKEKLYVVKEENKRQITLNANFIKMFPVRPERRVIIDKKIILGDKYEIEWYETEKGKINEFNFTLQLLNSDGVYVLYGKTYREKIPWVKGSYDKEILVLIAGLYTKKEEAPKVVRDVSEAELNELEYLLKQAIIQ